MTVPCKDLVFPKAHVIDFTIFKPTDAIIPDDMPSLQDVESNIGTFVQRFSKLVAQFSQLALDIEYDFNCQPVNLDLQIHGLTRLVYSSREDGNNGETAMDLARRNAPTLQHLIFWLKEALDTLNLI
ncbi:hypothetical protein GGI20_003613 [Coemansia sp. BCRC 34301]|nr:hypothetical protein GGI20_003613 [Coemansia sp. BCRC 34301]